MTNISQRATTLLMAKLSSQSQQKIPMILSRFDAKNHMSVERWLTSLLVAKLEEDYNSCHLLLVLVLGQLCPLRAICIHWNLCRALQNIAHKGVWFDIIRQPCLWIRSANIKFELNVLGSANTVFQALFFSFHRT
jgi:hypothetical protein